MPPETELWNRVESTAREVFGTYGFGEIRPPVFEPTELFARAVGGETDIVSKEMYVFEEQAGGDILRARENVRNCHFDYDRPKSLEVFSGFLGDFERRVKDGLKLGDIQPDEGGKRILEWFELTFKQFNSLVAQPPDLLYKAEIIRMVELIQKSVQVVPTGKILSLRPEATASICRAYIEHNMNQWPAPVKLYCLGPMFRRERPQKGRYRQFYQIDAEVLGGTDAPGIDAEVIEMVMVLFERLGLEGVQLEINSIGHSGLGADGMPVCRRAYVEKLRAALREVEGRLGDDSRRRIETNPLRVLDSKLEHEQAIIAKLPKIGDHLCAECAKHYAEVKRQLDLRGVAYRENWRLVRGLDYYMRTTFEIIAPGLGSQNAVCGGGRYDGLVELLGGPPTKGIGFAIGEDRLILSLQEAGKADTAKGRDVYIAWMGEKAQTTAIAAAQKLRAAGLRVELPAVEQKFGKALGQADRLGSRYALILGEDEVASGQWTVKTLADGSQEKVAAAVIVEVLKRQKPE